jgi:hypothetical protein
LRKALHHRQQFIFHRRLAGMGVHGKQQLAFQDHDVHLSRILPQPQAKVNGSGKIFTNPSRSLKKSPLFFQVGML